MRPTSIALAVGAALGLALAFPAYPAGNVTAQVDAGRLTLDGDDGPNALAVTAAAEPDGVLVLGLDGTTVNGLSSFTAADVRRLVARTGGGADRLELRQVTIQGGVQLRLGTGNDVVVLEQVRVRRGLDVRTSRGADTVVIGPLCRVDRSLLVRTGNDRDSVLLESSVVSGAVVATGRGDDVLTIFDTTVRSETRIFTGIGEDAVFLELTEFVGDADLNLGDDDDFLGLDTVAFDDDADLDGGSDDDVLSLRGLIDVDDALRVDGFEWGG